MSVETNPLYDGTLEVKVHRRPPTPQRLQLFPDFDGYLRSAADAYATACAGAVDQVNSAGSVVYVGQIKAGGSPLYRLLETFVEFPLALIPAGATIDEAILQGRINYDATTTDFTIEAFAFDFGASMTAADWRTPAQLGALTKVAQKPTAGLASGKCFLFDDVALAAAITPGGTLRLVLASSRLRSSTAPTGGEYLNLCSTEATSIFMAMRLIVTYTPAFTPAEVDITDAPPLGLRLSNSDPGGFGAASFQLPVSDPDGPYHAEVVKGALVVIKHGVPATTLFEGEITNDVSHALIAGGKARYEVTCGGLWWRAQERRDFAEVLLDDDIGQWFISPLAAQGYTVDVEGRIFIGVDAGQPIASGGKAAGIFYWLADGMGDPYAEIKEFMCVWNWRTASSSGTASYATIDYSRITPYGTGVASPWIELVSYTEGEAVEGKAIHLDLTGLGAQALRIKFGIPSGTTGLALPREVEVWDPCVVVAPIGGATITNISVANPTVVTTSGAHGLTSGDRVFIYGVNGTPKIDGWRTVTVLTATTFSVEVNVTVAGSSGALRRGWRVDEALDEIAGGALTGMTLGLAEATDTDAIGHLRWNLCARPHCSRADALNSVAMLRHEPFAFGFWDDWKFHAHEYADPRPAANHYTVEAAAPGIDCHVLRAVEESPTHVKVLYSYRAFKDALDPDSYKKSSYPDGIVAQVCRPELLESSSADLRVDVWDEFSDIAMTADEACDLGDQILDWIDANQFVGTVVLRRSRIDLASSGDKLAAYIRGGDLLNISDLTGYDDLLITGVDVEVETGIVTLSIGELRREFVARARAALDSAIPKKKRKKRL